MSLKLARYKAGLWRNVTDAVVRQALKELADKLDRLAFDVDGGLVFVGAILIVLGDVAVPSGWEVVVELNGRMPMGTVAANNDAGTTGGANTHTHTLTLQDNPPAGGLRAMNNGSGSGTVVTLTDGSHTHGNGGSANAASHLPPYVKVLFCRRTRPESR